MLHKSLLTLSMVLSIVCLGHAQDLQKEINEQVWKPFVDNFNAQNSDGFMAVHSKDLIRSPRDSKQLMTWDEYRKVTESDNASAQKDGMKVHLELHFTERIANAKQAIDVGVYKTVITMKDGKTQSFYGRFHVALRKENGVWKILVDTDSTEGNTIGEKEFVAAKVM